jgi:hypothetical protein
MKNWSVYFKVKGYKGIQLELVQAKTIRDALDKFEQERPSAVVSSIS